MKTPELASSTAPQVNLSNSSLSLAQNYPCRLTLNATQRNRLACAALTFCADGADAMLYALLHGIHTHASDNVYANDSAPLESSLAAAKQPFNAAYDVLQQLIALQAAPHDQQLLHELDEQFKRGVAAWGQELNARGWRAFHTRTQAWLQRLALLDTADEAQLYTTLTRDGAYWLVTAHDDNWPQQLGDLALRSDWAPPLCLWGMGNPHALTACSAPIALVGSRGATDYGVDIARQLGSLIAERGHSVISGGAMGVDAAAHWGATSIVDAREKSNAATAQGRALAVFAGGLDTRGPQVNAQLFARILATHGALISELPPATVPHPARFLLRNRLIAALSATTIVVQARLRSGALNTAHWAHELNREVYAVPGIITQPQQAGCNQLIFDQKATLLPSLEHVTALLHEPDQPRMNVHTTDTAETANAAENLNTAAVSAASERADETDVARTVQTLMRTLPRSERASMDTLVNALMHRLAPPTHDQDAQPRISHSAIITALGQLTLSGVLHSDAQGYSLAASAAHGQVPQTHGGV